MEKVKAVFPGSFDPITYGHIDIVRRVAPFFDEIIILIGDSASKGPLCTLEERQALASEALTEFKNVKVDICHGLTVDYMRKNGCSLILRGLRGVIDLEFEYTMAAMNRKLAPEIETMMVGACPDFAVVSSSLIKEIVVNGGSVSKFVPSNVEKALKKHLLK